MSVEHQPDCAGFRDERGRVEGICKDWCWSHDACEPIREPFFIVCGECFHVFQTAEELVDAFMKDEPPDRDAPKAEDITFCPHCIHDF